MRPPLVVLQGDLGQGRDSRPVAVLVVADVADATMLASVHAALERRDVFRPVLVTAGPVSGELRRQLGLPAPEHRLTVPPDSPAAQIAATVVAAEALLGEMRPAVVIVTGASDAVLGVSLAAVKLGIAVSRVGAGRRAWDWGAQAEVNRVLLDTMADSLFTGGEQESAVLAAEGASAGRVHLVGSTVADTALGAARAGRGRDAWRDHGLERGRYVLVLLEQTAGSVEDERLARTVEALAHLARRADVVLPVSSHLRDRLQAMGDVHRLEAAGVRCIPLPDPLVLVSLQIGAGAIVTDSGVVQEATSALGVGCFTVASSTDHEITVTHGTNVLLGDDASEIAEVSLRDALPVRCAIPLWDGRAGERIADVLIANYALVRAV